MQELIVQQSKLIELQDKRITIEEALAKSLHQTLTMTVNHLSSMTDMVEALNNMLDDDMIPEKDIIEDLKLVLTRSHEVIDALRDITS